MRALTFEGIGRLVWRELPAPKIQAPTDALVRPLAVARCDLDAAIFRGGAPFKNALLARAREALPASVRERGPLARVPFAPPYVVGHEAVGEVIAVGDAVRGVAVGARVLIPFQVSCGACATCRRGRTASCSAVGAGSMYGFGRVGGDWGGFMVDEVRVPFADAMLVEVPRELSPSLLSGAGDNVSDGLRCVDGPLLETPGADVLVVGGGAPSVGLHAAGWAVALGARSVGYLDQDRDRLELAARLGAKPIEQPYTARYRERHAITVDASADHAGLELAVVAAEPGGTCTSVGIYFEQRTPFPMLAAYKNGVRFVTGRVQSRGRAPRVLELLRSKVYDPSVVQGRVSAWEDAAEAFLEARAKVIVERAR